MFVRGVVKLRDLKLTQLRDLTTQHSRGIQVRKGGGRRGIGKVVSRHVDSLHGSNGTRLGGSNALLQTRKIRGQGGLVTDSGRDTTEEGGHLGAGLGEPVFL